MKYQVGLAALSCLLGGAQCKALKWSLDRNALAWAPAHETLGLVGDAQASPEPTSAPELKEFKHREFKRGSTDNTCAFLSGLSDEPLGCPTTDVCVYNSIVSALGCCPETSSHCAIPTFCLDSTKSALFTTNNGWTLWCGSSSYPYCVTHSYAPADPYSGYTFLDCAVAAETDTVYFFPTDTTSTTKKSSTTTSRSSSSTTTTSQTSSTTSSQTFGPTTSAASSSSTPVGPIVGGVVGGVAVLGLIGLGAFFLIRKSKKNNEPPPATPGTAVSQAPPGPPPPNSGYPSPQPGMAQYPPPQPGYSPTGFPPPAGFVAADNRASMAKTNYSVTNSVYDPSMMSPPGSPPPQSPSPQYLGQYAGQHADMRQSSYGQPSPTGGSTYSPQQGYAQSPQQGYQQPPQQGYPPPQGHQGAHEMPTERGHGNVSELG